MAEFSPDGSHLAYVRPDGVHTLTFDGSDPSLAIAGTTVDGIAWAPDGGSLLVASNYASDVNVGISIVRLDSAAPAITGLVTPGHAPSWQPVLLDPRLAD